MAALASSKDAPAGDMRMANINAAAVVRDYQVKPRLDYRTIAGVNGPCDPCQRQVPKYAEIVNLTLGNGERRKGQVLEIRAPVQSCRFWRGLGIDNRHTTCEFTGDVLKMPISEEMLALFNGRAAPSMAPPVLAEDSSTSRVCL